jgi:hypothetical protein
MGKLSEALIRLVILSRLQGTLWSVLETLKAWMHASLVAIKPFSGIGKTHAMDTAKAFFFRLNGAPDANLTIGAAATRLGVTAVAMPMTAAAAAAAAVHMETATGMRWTARRIRQSHSPQIRAATIRQHIRWRHRASIQVVVIVRAAT